MNVLIVEDEGMAAKRLSSLLEGVDSQIHIMAKLDSVKRTVNWLEENEAPDLIFLDIQLADGLSFEIFEKTDVPAPVIFTTAFDEYAIQAFKVNSIDYLLKPIDPEELQSAIDKFNRQYGIKQDIQPRFDLSAIEKAMQMMTRQYKERFVVKIGEHIKTVNTTDALYFFSESKATYLQTANKRFIIDYTLEQLESLVDPDRFYRINRKFLVTLDAVKNIVSYTNSRLRLILKDNDTMDAVVSRDRVQDFKKWLDR